MARQRGNYKKTAARREQILEAAVTVFARSGYTAGSVNEIARVVGMTQTGILHHFPGGKVALLRAVMERRDQIAQEILAGRQGRRFLRGLLEISRQQAGQRGIVQLYRILSAEATDPEHPAHRYFRDRFRLISDRLTETFAELRDQGELREGVDPERAALSCIAMVEGLELLWINGFDIDVADGVRHHLNTFLTTGIDPLPAPEDAPAAPAGPAASDDKDPAHASDR
ncbi:MULTISPECIES: TetR/AcrR family transcriptional regulator [unclassified Nocardiopsis]|uniref:TetR/AcrR family transcriptional regulator n=1 Tax=unclassified Nocardiopsis TaxID=2649073 RepID=UPI001359F250|nr:MULTISPECIES: TetR/AcrR family transcriptional regulator [unclassified Nocardiopsis]